MKRGGISWMTPRRVVARFRPAPEVPMMQIETTVPPAKAARSPLAVSQSEAPQRCGPRDPMRIGTVVHAPVLFLPAVALMAILLSGGCGYTQMGSAPTGGYQWKSEYREDVHTVAVPIFTNRTFYRGAEFGLTKAIINQLEGQTPYKVVSRERADTLLEGSIENVHVRTLSLDQYGRVIPQEQLFVMDVNFTWKDLRTGKVLCERKDYEQTAPYYPTLGETQFLAQQQSVEVLALAIVHELQADW